MRVLLLVVVSATVFAQTRLSPSQMALTDSSVANLGANLSVSGVTNILSYACNIPIGDGEVHTIGNAPFRSCFNGVTTLAGVASIPINGSRPFSWINTSSNNIFTSATGAYQLTDAAVSKIDIAWLCLQAALIQGRAYVPAGTYIVGSSLALPLVIGTSNDIPGPMSGTYTMLSGDGPRTSIIKAGSDWGAGMHLMICGDPTGTPANGLGRYGSNCAGDVRGLGLFSSSSALISSIGTVGIQMDGFGWGARLRIQDIEVTGFNHDLTIVGDHTAFIRVHLLGGAYGLYFPAADPNNFADLEFYDLRAEQQSIAAIGVSNHATISATFSGETYLSAPYAILGEADTDGTCADITNQVTFDRLMSEFTGNALIADDTGYSSGVYTDSRKCRRVNKILIRDLYFSWGNNHFWGGSGARQRRAAIDVSALNMSIDNLECDSGCWNPNNISVPSGSSPIGTMNLNGLSPYGQTRIVGAVSNWITNSGTLPLMAGSFGPAYGNFAFEDSNMLWGGFIDLDSPVSGATYSTLSAGDVIQSNHEDWLTPGGSYTDNEPPVGICAQNGVSISAYIPIVNHGQQAVSAGYQATTFGSGAPFGPWKMATGIGLLYISAAGQSGTPGTYSWVASGGNCSVLPSGTFTVGASGSITSFTISQYGSGCTSAPSISTAAATGLTGAQLSPKWPAAIAIPASNWQDGMILGTGRGGTESAAGNSVVIALRGLQ